MRFLDNHKILRIFASNLSTNSFTFCDYPENLITSTIAKSYAQKYIAVVRPRNQDETHRHQLAPLTASEAWS
jgi:hypothetical protein